MSKNPGKTWCQGYHVVPSTSKYLAGDPDLKFILFDTSVDSDIEDIEEESVHNSNEELKDFTWEVKPKNPEHIATGKTTDSVTVHSKAFSDSVGHCSSPSNDIPLSPCTRKDMVEFLNCCIEEQVNIEDDC